MTVVYFLAGFLLVSLGANLIGWPYWLGIWYNVDRTLNTIAFGDVDETISSRWGKAILRGNKLAILVARITFLEGHYIDSVDEGVGRNRVPVAMGVVGIIFVIVAAVAVFRG